MTRFKNLFIFCMLLMFPYSIIAQNNATNIINKVISTYNKSKGIKANIIVKSQHGNISGTIMMQGTSYYLVANGIKSWFNGTTQWTYSPNTEEVNVTNPSPQDLQTTNPYSAILYFKNNYDMSLLKNSNSNLSVVKFVPKAKRADIIEVILSINNKNWLIHSAIVKLSNKTSYNTTINNYQIGINYPKSTFVLNKKVLPAKTPIIDLR